MSEKKTGWLLSENLGEGQKEGHQNGHIGQDERGQRGSKVPPQIIAKPPKTYSIMVYIVLSVLGCLYLETQVDFLFYQALQPFSW